MNDNNRNMLLAVVLSMIVLFGWQFFVAGPQLERAQQQAEATASQQVQLTPADIAAPNGEGALINAAGEIVQYESRDAAVAASARVSIDTVALQGSLNLKGGRIDDLRLKRFHETTDDSSPIVTLLSPESAPEPYYIENGWVAASGSTIALPSSDTIWELETGSTLTETTPVVLKWDNGAGLVFRNEISVDENYMFSVTQKIENMGTGDVALYPYSRVARLYTPKTQNFFILHEGPIGVLGDANLVELSYSDLQKESDKSFNSVGGWLGFTDKYWAASIIPAQAETVNARFFHSKTANGGDSYRANFVGQSPVIAAAGGNAEYTHHAFAGAKIEAVIDSYEQAYGIDRFELLIDWGWFHFITKPMFYLIRFLYEILGNFGLAILAVTVIIKGIFLPLANKSYASMAAMRRVQPEMKDIQTRFKEDRAAQQKAMMELYKREKINPLSGCWPMIVQIPVFFSLYKVLFVTIEMRHAPFFGWIQDLAAPDPTNVFTLFGLIPWDPTVVPLIGSFMVIGIWPIIMGITMWVQMKLNPAPQDPSQAIIFTLMPIIFTFMLGSFPAGLVIYWAWNNFLSLTQQLIIMKRHGAEVNLWENITASFKRKPKAEKSE